MIPKYIQEYKTTPQFSVTFPKCQLYIQKVAEVHYQSTRLLCKTEIIKLWNNLKHFTISTSILEISVNKTKQT